MGFGFRRSKKIGPFRIGVSKSGLSASAGTKRVRVSRSTTGRGGTSINLGGGLRWFKSTRRRR
jgi:hypothetical protein